MEFKKAMLLFNSLTLLVGYVDLKNNFSCEFDTK